MAGLLCSRGHTCFKSWKVQMYERKMQRSCFNSQTVCSLLWLLFFLSFYFFLFPDIKDSRNKTRVGRLMKLRCEQRGWVVILFLILIVRWARADNIHKSLRTRHNRGLYLLHKKVSLHWNSIKIQMRNMKHFVRYSCVENGRGLQLNVKRNNRRVISNRFLLLKMRRTVLAK